MMMWGVLLIIGAILIGWACANRQHPNVDETNVWRASNPTSYIPTGNVRKREQLDVYEMIKYFACEVADLDRTVVFNGSLTGCFGISISGDVYQDSAVTNLYFTTDSYLHLATNAAHLDPEFDGISVDKDGFGWTYSCDNAINARTWFKIDEIINECDLIEKLGKPAEPYPHIYSVVQNAMRSGLPKCHVEYAKLSFWRDEKTNAVMYSISASAKM